MNAPLCPECLFYKHVPLCAGQCSRRTYRMPPHPSCIDERLDVCGIEDPKFFHARRQKLRRRA
jgi:hypothetical protein